jgi:hypothetical protein
LKLPVEIVCWNCLLKLPVEIIHDDYPCSALTSSRAVKSQSQIPEQYGSTYFDGAQILRWSSLLRRTSIAYSDLPDKPYKS